MSGVILSGQVAIRAVVEKVLSFQTGLDRVVLSGPDMDIGPEATLSLSMLLHELATNAVKYGALSTAEGLVQIAWRVESDGAPMLVLDWRETGGPPVASPPDRRGFGSKLIRMGLVGTGQAEVDYMPAGMRAEFRAPLSQVVK